MANSRLLSGFRLTSTTRSMRWTIGGAGGTITIPYNYPYRHTDNNETGGVNGYYDFIDQLLSAMNAQWPGNNLTAAIQGVDNIDPTGAHAEGRIQIHSSTNPVLTITANLTHADWTLDPRIIGWRDKTADKPGGGSPLWAEYVHRYGWYPATFLTTDVPQPEFDGSVEVAPDTSVDRVVWGEYQVNQVSWEWVPACLARAAAAADGYLTSDYGLTTGDLNCAFDSFGSDLARGSAEDWRIYPVITVKTSYRGDYVWAKNSPLWTRPLAMSSMVEMAPEAWSVVIEGMKAA